MRILGIDPGTKQLGWGILEVQQQKIVSVDHGCLKAPSKEAFVGRLGVLAKQVSKIVTELKPDVAAIEKIFLGKNVDSAFKLGHIRGICVVECQKQGAKIAEYSPREVKKSITGSGGSDKTVLRQFLYSQLGLIESGHSLDASDALAVAFCHHLQDQVNKRLRPMEGF